VHLVRVAALEKDDIVADFEAELLTLGQAIIHDKIVVIDPLDSEGFVITGSHNLGFKASYMNDENLVIIRNKQRLLKPTLATYSTSLSITVSALFRPNGNGMERLLMARMAFFHAMGNGSKNGPTLNKVTWPDTSHSDFR
jgi:phosphatidylserine/phosphatidylglycerophosphate/cardiolipin synthase-like enzyme